MPELPTPIPLQTPSQNTLKRYGLSEVEWRAMADAQAEACFVCLQKPTKGRLCIDHEHVKGWKHMPPGQRKLFVRGLLCFRCNTTFVGRGVTIERANRVALYLTNYQARRVDPSTLEKPKKSKTNNRSSK
jgi:hypothetical protein